MARCQKALRGGTRSSTPSTPHAPSWTPNFHLLPSMSIVCRSMSRVPTTRRRGLTGRSCGPRRAIAKCGPRCRGDVVAEAVMPKTAAGDDRKVIFHYGYRRSPDQDATTVVRHPVVVVGAGPVGLTAAID